MKNIFIAVALLAAITLSSCKKNDVVIVRLDETSLELVKGSEKQLKATVIPSDGSKVTWFSTNPEYVSVSETGLVKAEKIYFKNPTDTDASPVSIYCQCNGGAAECKVLVTPLDVKSIELKVKDHDQNEVLRLDPGSTKEFYVEYTPADADIDFSKLEWSTSDFFYVSVKKTEDTANAVITANWAGSATITARYSNMVSSLAVIVKHVPATSVTISSKEQNEVTEGYSLQLSASLVPENATVDKIWSIVEGEEYATISENGLLTGMKPGTVKVKVSAGEKYDEITITVKANN